MRMLATAVLLVGCGGSGPSSSATGDASASGPATSATTTEGPSETESSGGSTTTSDETEGTEGPTSRWSTIDLPAGVVFAGDIVAAPGQLAWLSAVIETDAGRCDVVVLRWDGQWSVEHTFASSPGACTPGVQVPRSLTSAAGAAPILWAKQQSQPGFDRSEGGVWSFVDADAGNWANAMLPEETDAVWTTWLDFLIRSDASGGPGQWWTIGHDGCAGIWRTGDRTVLGCPSGIVSVQLGPPGDVSDQVVLELAGEVRGLWGDAQTAFAVGVDGFVAHLEPTGWVRDPLDSEATYFALHGTGPDDVWAVGDALVTYDGTGWTRVDEDGAPPHGFALWLAEPGHPWVVVPDDMQNPTSYVVMHRVDDDAPG